MIAPPLSTRILNDGAEDFEVLVVEPDAPRAAVLFAVGGGGDPGRHLPLLRSIAAAGCAVAAPSCARLVSPAPSAVELSARARRLKLALDTVSRPDVPGAGVGHSIGAALLLMLAGARGATRAGEPVSVTPEPSLKRLALLTPATDFFRVPGALDGVQASVLAWGGSRDDITPPQTTQWLGEALARVTPAEVRIVADAGHFSFMNAPPPHVTETLPDRDGFLSQFGGDVAGFLLG